MAASFYESLEEKSSRLFFLLGGGCWVLGVDEVLRGGKLGFYYFGLMERIGLIRLISLNSGKYHPTLLFGLVQRLFRLNLLIGSKDNNKTDYFRIM